ncbi:MAG: hypothetical protein FJ098_07915 [Deltaproteobacteria bacterium]|nr:hypothetical protein [Deltaproteobacteria bacterium]
MRSACPHCEKPIPPASMVCPHCHSLLVQFEEQPKWPAYLGYGFLIVLMIVGVVVLIQYSGGGPPSEAEERQAIDPALQREQEEARKIQERRRELLLRIEEGKKLAEERRKDQEDWAREDTEKKQAYIQGAYKEFDDKATRLQARLLQRGEELIQAGAAVEVQEKIEGLLEEMDLINGHVERMLVLAAEGKVDQARVILDAARDRYKRFSLEAEAFLLKN